VLNAKAMVGSHDFLFVVLDTLRYDVAQALWKAGRTPNLAALLPPDGWELRHSPATFTYPAHHAFFTGFMPTPAKPGRYYRLFAPRFPRSISIGRNTVILDAPDIVSGLAGLGYHTVCIGGVGFFNKQSPMARVLPGLFAESHWNPSLGINNRHSAENQVKLACRIIAGLPASRRLFLYINVSALHHPNYFYLKGAKEDSIESHAAALEYVDSCLPPLFLALRKRGLAFGIVCSDHGTTYGDDGYRGHGFVHPAVLNVPYTEFVLPGREP
jgi:hypothetical protein